MANRNGNDKNGEGDGDGGFGQDVGRLIEEEDELRRISPSEGASGKHGSDYRHTFDLFLRLYQDAATIRKDPMAFIDAKGKYDATVINAYAKLMGLALRGMSELNKMRNNDKMVAGLLEAHTKDFAQSVAIELGAEVKAVIDAVDRGDNKAEVILQLKRLMHRKIPEIFLKSAGATLHASKEEYGLLN